MSRLEKFRALGRGWFDWGVFSDASKGDVQAGGQSRDDLAVSRVP